MLNEALAHFLGQLPPARDERCGIRPVPLSEFVIEHVRHDPAQLRKTAGPRQFCNGVAKFPPGSIAARRLADQFLELCNAEGHRFQVPITSVGAAAAIAGEKS